MRHGKASIWKGLLGVGIGLFGLAMSAQAGSLPTSQRSITVAERTAPKLERGLARKGMRYGAPLFIRIFKQDKQLEVWMETKNGQYELYSTYRICAYSGGLGPKLRQGDEQAPEGFYSVKAEALNPNSSFHLSFDLGFPNAFDRAHGRTGSFLMVHGSCISKGCYAMTDYRMEEIYTLAFAALKHGQYEIPVHIFPFRMTEANLKSHRRSRWSGFWHNLKEGYDMFEETRMPPMSWAEEGRYAFFPRPPRATRQFAYGAAPKPSLRPGAERPVWRKTPTRSSAVPAALDQGSVDRAVRALRSGVKDEDR